MKIIKLIRKAGVFLLTLLLCSSLTVLMAASRSHLDRLTMENLLLAKSARVSDTITRLTYYRAGELSALIKQNSGYADDFERIAPAIADDPSLLYVLIAPDGVVTNVYPLAGNEPLLEMNILKDGIGAAQATLAKESGQIVLGGPFELAEGGMALLARLPVFLDTPDGGREFWGLVSVAMRFPQVIDAIGLDELLLQGYGYEIYKLDPDGGERLTLASCQYDKPSGARVIEREISILNDVWHFQVFSLGAWYTDSYVLTLIFISVCISLLMARLQVVSVREKAASRAKSDFLASMSHEIRTPMNAVIGMSELLMEERLSERQLEYANDINVSATALLGIINDILDVSKIEAGKLSLCPVCFEPAAFIDSICSVMAYEAKSKNLEFLSERAPTLPESVYGDDVRLRQILLNLLGNAIKFTDKGFVRLAVGYSGGQIHISVSDSGIGIKESDIARLYDSFEQFDAGKNRGKQGTGLGLSITSSLVDMMGGEIRVQSVYGEGTTFCVDIPLPPADGFRGAGDFGAKTVSAPDARVLVVDDNKINRKVSQGLLRLHDIECDTAENGLEAIKKVRENDYDLVFIDHMMPEMDGATAALEIRKMGGRYSIGKFVIIALTANALPEARELFSASGMDDFLSKPIDKALLNRALAKWLPKEKQAVKAWAAPSPRERAEGIPSTALEAARFVSGLDIELGLSHTGGAAEYERSLRLLSEGIQDALEMLERHLQGGSLGEFSTDVHGLKGALAISGHAELAEAALRLETEAKNGNYEYCLRGLTEFSAALTAFGEEIGKIFHGAEETIKAGGTRDQLTAALAGVEDCLRRYDRDGALNELERLSGYSFGAELDVKLERLSSYLASFDLDLASELLEGFEL